MGPTILLVALVLGRVLPIPPIPPAGGPPDITAPVPDPNARSPGTDLPAEGLSLSPKFFRLPYYDESKGFTPGSRMDTPPVRQTPMTGGFNLSVPFP
ncbi:MAG TPA: hypothetical protein VLI93_16030 [Acetobacteraceae bacterium]|nr:hypothetical protein [Acetobacteraceae bacterium]